MAQLDLAKKNQQIKALKSEVNEFHPLLNELFRRLPDITHVEYTHGIHEMGADFVLKKQDQTLERHSYIGVVVKVGSIKQDHSKINEQIEECSVPRKADGGKKEIFISEVWVVTNGNISYGAQEKIHHKYRDKNIQFLQGTDITTYIDKFYMNYWTDISIELGNYFREVSESSKYLTKNVDMLDVADHLGFEIEQKFQSHSDVTHTDPGRTRAPKILSVNEILEKDNFIFIQGSMGTGKSSIISKLTKQFSTNEHFNSSKTVPFPVTFQDFINIYNSNIEEIIALINEKVSLDEINYLIMIDGLDELNEANTEKFNRVKSIYQTTNRHENCKVLITSRPFEELDLSNQIASLFSVFDIIPLSIKQIIKVVDYVCKTGDVKNKLLKDLEKSHLFKVLPRTPISAIILAKLLKQDIKEIPSTMTELYAKYTEIVLGRWNMSRGFQSQSEYDTVQNVTANVAKYMLDNQLPQLSLNEFKGMFDDYVNARKLEIDQEQVFESLISNEELFILDKNRSVINFVHRTFAEYFYAIHLNRDHSAFISENIYTLYWSNVYFFYFGLNRDSRSLVQELSNIEFSSPEARLAHTFHNGNLLLAAYLTPYEYIKQSVLNSYREASEFYEQAISKKIETPLLALPQMHILSIISYGLATSYGYDFFMDILEERSIEISTRSGHVSELEMAELFFINSTLVFNDKFNSFDLMINNYGRHIPLAFKIGIQHYVDIKKAGNHSSIVKKYLKDVKKSVQKTTGVRQAILQLLEKPIQESTRIN